MKKFIFMLFMLTILTSAKAQECFQNYYFVGNEIKVARTMLNLAEPDKWEPYHLIERTEITILFLDPKEDFTIETLNYALNHWERISSPELKLVVLLDKSNEDELIPTYQFDTEDVFYIHQNQVYGIGHVEWGSEDEEDNDPPLTKEM